ncbi:MAG: WecB/TagA/CpsF family glycosyltransferase [Gammaproteobacteria bacterium]|nr:WecB/TagA/CpsF family glycosyltransferase [Gammaproteobacteria bacterium]
MSGAKHSRRDDQPARAEHRDDDVADFAAIDSIDYYGSRVDATRYDVVYAWVKAWAQRREGRTIALAGVPTINVTRDDPRFKAAYEHADLVLPDGMPLVWALHHAGFADAERLCGPDLMEWFCRDAARDGIPVGLYGSTPQTLSEIRTNYTRRFPGLDVRYTYSPPFRPLADDEEAEVAADIRRAGVGILFVSLSFPEHAFWLARQRDRAGCVLVAVGGAFAIAAGELSAPPRWVQRAGLQWLFRILQEPRRLLKRYLVHNTRYLWLIASHLFGRSAIPRKRTLRSARRLAD